MPSLRSLVDTLGPPPSEIACDWLWQIESVPASFWKESPTAATDRSWADIEVSDDGILQLQPHDHSRIQAARQVLSGWVTRHAPAAVATSSRAIERYASSTQATSSAASNVVDGESQTQIVTQTLNRQESSQLPQVDASEQTLSKSNRRMKTKGRAGQLTRQRLNVNHQHSNHQHSNHQHSNHQHSNHQHSNHQHSSHQHSNRQHSNSHRINRQRQLVAVGVVAALVALACVWSALSSAPAVQAPPLALAELSDSSAASRSQNTPLLHELPVAEVSDQLGPASLEPLVLDSTAIASDSPSVTSITPDPFAPLASSGGKSLQLDGLQIASSLTGPTTDSNSSAATSPNIEVDPLDRTSGGQPDMATSSDAIMQSVQQAMQSAQSQADAMTAQSPETSEASESTASSIFFARDMLRQKLSLPKHQPPKSRDESWSVELELPDEFAQEPESLQQGSVKNPVRLCVFEDAAKSPRTCIVMHIAQRNVRENSLTVQFCASSEDLPHLTLPLDRKFLDPLRVRLQSATIQMRSLSDAATVAAASGGSLLTKDQRQTLKVQLKLAERLCEVVADADRLASLLEGELKLVAQ